MTTHHFGFSLPSVMMTLVLMATISISLLQSSLLQVKLARYFEDAVMVRNETDNEIINFFHSELVSNLAELTLQEGYHDTYEDPFNMPIPSVETAASFETAMTLVQSSDITIKALFESLYDSTRHASLDDEPGPDVTDRYLRVTFVAIRDYPITLIQAVFRIQTPVVNPNIEPGTQPTPTPENIQLMSWRKIN